MWHTKKKLKKKKKKKEFLVSAATVHNVISVLVFNYLALEIKLVFIFKTNFFTISYVKRWKLTNLLLKLVN